MPDCASSSTVDRPAAPSALRNPDDGSPDLVLVPGKPPPFHEVAAYGVSLLFVVSASCPHCRVGLLGPKYAAPRMLSCCTGSPFDDSSIGTRSSCRSKIDLM